MGLAKTWIGERRRTVVAVLRHGLEQTQGPEDVQRLGQVADCGIGGQNRWVAACNRPVPAVICAKGYCPGQNYAAFVALTCHGPPGWAIRLSRRQLMMVRWAY